MTEKKPMSLLGIIALICALLCFTFPVAIVLAIIDLTKNKDDGKNKILSIIALCVSGLWLVIGVINSGKNKNEVSEPSVVAETFIVETVGETTPETSIIETAIDEAETSESGVIYDNLTEYGVALQAEIDANFGDSTAQYIVLTDEENNMVTVEVIQAGACDTAFGVVDGDVDSISTWETVKTSMASLSLSLYEETIAHTTIENPIVSIMLMNDQNTDNTLLIYTNGNFVYDATRDT